MVKIGVLVAVEVEIVRTLRTGTGTPPQNGVPVAINGHRDCDCDSTPERRRSELKIIPPRLRLHPRMESRWLLNMLNVWPPGLRLRLHSRMEVQWT
ncbi:hypothetical protein HOLleu_15963 [Holothuria leucospilota]|uniref:Uncharacterized protein n=1 Tax=Holothuria leucospilota TaxID=206669 RepID=A0A9Q1C4G7_HOLLE|nr:hypothetical protein HOLleu_15963 [Holothuria leucospilota]